jgi:four helix bundle protein
VRNYRDLDVWVLAHEVTKTLYLLTRPFPKEELFALTSQVRRSSFSMGSNLAEGCGRYSDAEMARSVRIASGSASELDYQVLLAFDLEFISRAEYESISLKIVRVRRMLTDLHQALTRSIAEQQSATLQAKSQEPRAKAKRAGA